MTALNCDNIAKFTAFRDLANGEPSLTVDDSIESIETPAWRETLRTSRVVGTRFRFLIPLLLTGLLCSAVASSNESDTVPYGQPGAPGVTVSLVPSQVTVQPGDPLSIDVVISGLGAQASASAGSFDLAVTWDDALFTYNSLTFGTDLGDVTMAEAIVGTVPMATSVQAFEVSLLPAATLNMNQPASFTLATINFDGTGMLGDAPFDVGGTVSDENGIALQFVAEGTQVSTGTVLDIPTLGDLALLLMMIGLCVTGLIFLRRVS